MNHKDYVQTAHTELALAAQELRAAAAAFLQAEAGSSPEWERLKRAARRYAHAAHLCEYAGRT